MQQTCILTPLEDPSDDEEKKKEHKHYKQKWHEIHSFLELSQEGEDMTFDEFLSKFNISNEQYLQCVRTSITRDTIFVKRNLNEIRINNYNKHCLLAWRANMDIQFILDVYACAMYIVSYITKSQRGMSKLLHNAVSEARDGNVGIREQVRDIGSKFINHVEISAQEAVYIVLQLPMKKASREVVFINTSPPDERVQLVKSLPDIAELEDDSEDIECSNMIKRYSERPKSLELITLADYAAWYDVRAH